MNDRILNQIETARTLTIRASDTYHFDGPAGFAENLDQINDALTSAATYLRAGNVGAANRDLLRAELIIALAPNRHPGVRGLGDCLAKISARLTDARNTLAAETVTA